MRGSQSIRSKDKAVWTRGGGPCPQVCEQVPAKPADKAAHDMAAVPPRSRPTHCRGEWTQPAQTTWALVFAALWLAISFPLTHNARAAYGYAPGAASPVGSPTVPPSSYENGTIATPNPLDNSSNLVITGNVGGLKQFQAPIPYSSTTSFGAPLGSTRLDSFLRYSTIPQGTGDYRPSPGYDAFYSPTGTVSSIRPGQSVVSAPISPRLASGIGQWQPSPPPDVMEPGQAVQTRVPTGRANPAPDTWSAARTPEQIRQLITGDPMHQFADSPALPQDDRPAATSEDYQQQLEQFRRQLEMVKAQASQLEWSLATGQSPPPESWQPPTQTTQAIESPAKVQGILPPGPGRASDDSLPSVTTTLPEVSELVKPPVSPASQQSAATHAGDASARIDRIAALFRPQTTRSSGDPSALQRVRDTAGTTKPRRLASAPLAPDTPPDSGTGSDAEAQVSHQPISDQAKPKYENLDPAAREKFDRYMKAAELYQRQGQYARAAESFAIASVYAPGESRVYLGRSQALLAAGDYAGSAMFLMKTVELDARQGLAKVDLVALVGGPDLFIQRITELEQRAQQGGDTANLHWLLAYVYQQMDRPAEAQAALEAAAKAQPRSTATAALQAAINP